MNNRRRLAFELSFNKGMPTMKIHKKYENKVKWLTRTVTFIGILSSFFGLDPIYGALLSFILVIINVFFEKTVFKFRTMFIQPLPDFEYDTEKWYAMLYGLPVSEGTDYKLGFVFNDQEYATRFFDLLRSYNNGEDYDTENNICISLIIESLNDYNVYVYPNPERKVITEFMKAFENQNLLETKREEEQDFLVTQLTICKEFPFSHQGVGSFRANYKEDRPVKIAALLFENGSIKEIPSIKPIIKDKIKVTRETLLEKTDFEYQFQRLIRKSKRKY